jgi:hypothetical protein
MVQNSNMRTQSGGARPRAQKSKSGFSMIISYTSYKPYKMDMQQ